MHSNRYKIDRGRFWVIILGLAWASGALAIMSGCSSDGDGNRNIVAQPVTLSEQQALRQRLENDPTVPRALKQAAASQSQGPAWMKPKTASGQATISR